jgi:hypothetical protein
MPFFAPVSFRCSGTVRTATVAGSGVGLGVLDGLGEIDGLGEMEGLGAVAGLWSAALAAGASTALGAPAISVRARMALRGCRTIRESPSPAAK